MGDGEEEGAAAGGFEGAASQMIMGLAGVGMENFNVGERQGKASAQGLQNYAPLYQYNYDAQIKE